MRSTITPPELSGIISPSLRCKNKDGFVCCSHERRVFVWSRQICSGILPSDSTNLFSDQQSLFKCRRSPPSRRQLLRSIGSGHSYLPSSLPLPFFLGGGEGLSFIWEVKIKYQKIRRLKSYGMDLSFNFSISTTCT